MDKIFLPALKIETVSEIFPKIIIKRPNLIKTNLFQSNKFLLKLDGIILTLFYSWTKNTEVLKLEAIHIGRDY